MWQEQEWILWQRKVWREDSRRKMRDTQDKEKDGGNVWQNI